MLQKPLTLANTPAVIDIKDLKIAFGNFEVLKGAK